MTLPDSSQGVGTGEDRPAEDFAGEFLLNIGFERHDLVLAEGLVRGSVDTIFWLAYLARGKAKDLVIRGPNPFPGYDDQVVRLLQNFERLRLEVERYLQRFGAVLEGDLAVGADGVQTWREVVQNESRPYSINRRIREEVLEYLTWFPTFFRAHREEIRCVWGGYQPGPVVTARPAQVKIRAIG